MSLYEGDETHGNKAQSPECCVAAEPPWTGCSTRGNLPLARAASWHLPDGKHLQVLQDTGDTLHPTESIKQGMGTGMLTIIRLCPSLRAAKPYFGSKAMHRSLCLMESVGGKQQQDPGSSSVLQGQLGLKHIGSGFALMGATSLSSLLEHC